MTGAGRPGVGKAVDARPLPVACAERAGSGVGIDPPGWPHPASDGGRNVDAVQVNLYLSNMVILTGSGGQSMKTVPITEAKARFSALLGDVERGNTVSITRHGKTIARIVPELGRDPEEVREAIGEMRKLRASLPKTGTTIEEVLSWRHEGHGF